MTDAAPKGSTSTPSPDLPFASSHILTDIQIREAIAAIGLIGGPYKLESARYASYELHASDYAEKLVYDDEVTGHVEMPLRGSEVVIEPGCTVKLYTAETINLPSNILSLVVALGQLFAAGLMAGSTYVDPGSRGEIYISLTNASPRAIRIPVGCPIARAVFFVLGSAVEIQHGGPETRRRIGLRVGPPMPAATRSRDVPHRTSISTQLAWHKLSLYVLSGLFVGLAWATVARPIGNAFLNVAVGDSLPRAARVVVPPAILGVIAFMSKDLRLTARQVVRAIAKKFDNWLRGLPD